MPWFRGDIIVLLGDEAPPVWLNVSHPRVRVVRHRSYFRNPDELPTFNSDAIFANIHRVPGVGPFFIKVRGGWRVRHGRTNSQQWPASARKTIRVPGSWCTRICRATACGGWRRIQLYLLRAVVGICRPVCASVSAWRVPWATCAAAWNSSVAWHVTFFSEALAAFAVATRRWTTTSSLAHPLSPVTGSGTASPWCTLRSGRCAAASPSTSR